MTRSKRPRGALLRTSKWRGAVAMALIAWSITSIAGLGGTGILVATASAAPKPAPKPMLDVKAIDTQLRSQDAAQITVGLTAMRAGSREAAPLVPVVERLLDRGLPSPVAKSAIDALAEMGLPSSTTVIARYTHHRDVEVRRAAVSALRRTRGPDAIPTLRAALSDSDNRVRSAAASGLGSLNAVDTMDDLYRALDHKVLEAAAAIGQICKGEACDRFVARAGKLPLPVLTSGIDQLLFRPASEVSDDQKVKMIGEVRELGTQEVNRYLNDVLGRWPATGSARVKAALDQAVQATRSSPGDAPKPGSTP